MSDLQTLQSLVKPELKAVEMCIRENIISDIPLAKHIADHIINSGGKRVRPLVVLLSALACDTLNEQTITLAATIELLHTATLLHDDVIDDSRQRRGKPTANEHWGNEASVLVGDLLYARAFGLIANLKHHAVTQTIADATRLIVEGEVMQLMHCHDTTTTQEDYIEIVKRKTGMLFAVAAQAGPVIAGLDAQKQKALYDYGCYLGIAFQILDDALDYTANSESLGKNLGDDLQEGKPTLPLIYILRHGTNEQKQTVARAIKTPETADLKAIQAIIEKTQAITYCKELAEQMAYTAKHALDCLADSEAKQALIVLCEQVVSRDY